MTDMHAVHIGSLDLNLLVALDALLAEKSVTRAAERVGITQSAMSHALSRLRSMVGDELLVRTSTGMVPTARAEAMAPALHDALDAVARALSPPAAFDPKTAKRRIVVGTSDYAELVLLPELARRLEREAPGIDLRVHTLDDDMTAPLASGALDLAIAPVRPRDQGAGIYAKRLFDEKFVCVVRRSNPLAKKKLTLARFAAASHALIAPRETEGGFVDDALARMGMSRRVVVLVPHFLIAPHIVATTDLILTLAARVANALEKPLGLAVLAPPAELGLTGFTMSMLWHERTHADPAHRWMRELFADVAKKT